MGVARGKKYTEDRRRTEVGGIQWRTEVFTL